MAATVGLKAGRIVRERRIYNQLQDLWLFQHLQMLMAHLQHEN